MQHDHDDFVNFSVSLGEVRDKDALLRRIATTIASHDILRLKGFAALEDVHGAVGGAGLDHGARDRVDVVRMALQGRPR